MFKYRREIPVFHEDDFELILRKFNLFEKLQRNELLCSICDILIEKDNFGCIYLIDENVVKVSCSDSKCLEKVSLVI